MLKGIEVSLIGLIVVFLGLISISLLIHFIGRIFTRKQKNNSNNDTCMPSDVSVAIAMALYYFQLSREENNDLTFTENKNDALWTSGNRIRTLYENNRIYNARVTGRNK